MNKTFFMAILIMISSIFANPNPPDIKISEIFPYQNELKLELNITNALHGLASWDSLKVKTNETTVHFNISQGQNYNGCFIVNDSMLSAPLVINNINDKLVFSSLVSTNWNIDSVSWGQGTEIEKLYNDQSIVKYSCISSKDNTPSPGSSNTTYKGTLTGYLLDSLNNFVPNKSFYLREPWIVYYGVQYYQTSLEVTTDANGHYSVPAFSRKYVYDKLVENHNQPSFIYAIPDTFYVEPDSVTNHDFHLKYFTDIEEVTTKKPDQAVIFNFPNPFNPSTTISYSLPDNVLPATTSIVVSNIKGEQVAVFHPNSIQGSFTFDAKAKSTGFYNYRLMQGSVILKSGSMVVLK